MTTSKEKSRRPKFDIPTISGDASKETAQVERVMNFLVTGTTGGVSMAHSGGEQSGGAVPPPLALAIAEPAAPAERPVSLDHLFHFSARRPARPRDDGEEESADYLADGGTVVASSGTAETSDLEGGAGEVLTATSVSIAGAEGRAGEVRERGKGTQVRASSHAAASLPAVPFEVFIARLGKLMRPSQREICRVIYENTVASGRSEYETTVPDLARHLGLKKRACFRLVSKMEELGFLKRDPLQGAKRRMLGVTLRLKIDAFK